MAHLLDQTVLPETVHPPMTMLSRDQLHLPQRELTPTRWFREEVQAHELPLKAYLRGSFPSLRDVDNVVQESYCRICKARTVHPIQCSRAFLFRVARNMALNLLSRERASPINAVKDFGSLVVVDDRPTAAANLPQKEMAAPLGIAEETVEVQRRDTGSSSVDAEVMRRRIETNPRRPAPAGFGRCGKL